VTPFGAEESASVCGGHCWIERRLFEVVGQWGACAGSPRTVVLLDRHSQHAAWRAGQWWERLPVRAGIEREGLVVAPPGWQAALGSAGEAVPAFDGDAPMLAVLHRVLLARLLTRYRRHLERTSPVSDGPVIRTLGQVVADVRSDRDDGESALIDLLDASDTLRRSWEAAEKVESAFVVDYGGGI
jgi:hypothetical protein